MMTVRRFAGAVAIVGLSSCALLLLAPKPAESQKGGGAQAVTIVNPLPVPITASAPIQVFPAMTPFLRSLYLQWTEGGAHSQFLDPAVPESHVLVIEHVSARVNVLNKPKYAMVLVTTDATQHWLDLPCGGPTAALDGWTYFTCGGPTRIYLAPGEKLGFTMLPLEETGMGGFNVVFSGYVTRVQ